MTQIKSYKELGLEIDIQSTLLEAERMQHKEIGKLIALKDIDNELERAERSLEICQVIVSRLEEYRQRILESLARSEDINKIVVFMRDIEGFSLRAIAEELRFSHDYIKRVSARNN